MKYPKILLCITWYVLFLPALYGQSKNQWWLVVGGYTKLMADRGIAVYDFDAGTGDLEFRSVTGQIENPSYLAISKDGNHLYAVSEKSGAGAVVAYQFDHSL